jgi:hypothetical protein
MLANGRLSARIRTSAGSPTALPIATQFIAILELRSRRNSFAAKRKKRFTAAADREENLAI